MADKNRSTSNSTLATLFSRLAPRLLGAGKRMLGSTDDASDAMQDTFMKLWTRGGEMSEGMVVTAMRNTCIDTIRRRREVTAIDDTALSQTPENEIQEPSAGDLYEEVNRLIMQTPTERDRDIMLMRDRDGYELDAIAARTGLTEANIRVILSRARRAVREAYRNRK